jgi:hypothetical protein
MQRRLADRLQQVAVVVPGEGADGDRRVGRAEGGRADLAGLRPLRAREDRDRGDVVVLPWSVPMPSVV